MPNSRKNALNEVLHRKANHATDGSRRVSQYFGENTFHLDKMRECLTEEAYKIVKSAIEHGTHVDRLHADQIATAMKDWAISKGATHYTHWFQPNQSDQEKRLSDLKVIYWYSKNQMHLHFQTEESEIHLRQEVTVRGIHLLQLL